MIADVYFWVTVTLPRALRGAWREFVSSAFPDWAWKREQEKSEFPVIKFPTNLVMQEVEEDGYTGFMVVEPGSYYIPLLYPSDSVRPGRRSLVDFFEILAEFAETDDITCQDISIQIKFDPTLREKEKSVVVVPSVEEEES